MTNQYMPVRMIIGKGSVRKHADLISYFGKRCLIVTGAASAKVSGALSDVMTVLDNAQIAYTVYDGIKQNPTVKSCIEAGKNNADFVIGIGGGSVLDAAKAISVFSANPGLDEDGFYAKQWPNKPLRILLVGTTAGTGSEVTKVSVLTDKQGRKHSIHDDLLYAECAFGDPDYLKSVPEKTALYTAADVLMHAVESRFSKKADVFAKTYAEAAVSKVLKPLNCIADGVTVDCMEQLYEASILAGMAINITGTCFPHNVGYYLTEKYGVPHGAACAVFLPEFVAHVKKTAPDEFMQFLQNVEADESALLYAAAMILKRLKDISLCEADVNEALPRWENNGSVKNTIGSVGVDYIKTALMKFTKNEKET